MTNEELAELDAIMAKATAGLWHVCQCVQLEGDTLFQLEARVEPDTLQCVSTDIAGEEDAAAIIALHNAYPDLRAHIDAQAATIALTPAADAAAIPNFADTPIPVIEVSEAELKDMLSQAISDSLDIDWSPADGAAAIMREDWFQTLIRIPVKTMAITRSAQSLGEQVKRLQAFKTYVHERLDAAGIETYPHGTHSAAGCRVGDRLDIALQMHEQGGDLAVAIGEHAFREGWDRAVAIARNEGWHYTPMPADRIVVAQNSAWDDYTPLEELKGGGDAKTVAARAAVINDAAELVKQMLGVHSIPPVHKAWDALRKSLIRIGR